MTRPDPVPTNEPSHEQLFLRLVKSGVFRIKGDGTVWRVGVLRSGKLTPCKPRRAEYEATNGYLRLRFYYLGVRYRVSAHRVVYLWFCDDLKRHHVVDHRNGDRQDNRPTNLQAVTQKVNVQRGVRRKKCQTKNC